MKTTAALLAAAAASTVLGAAPAAAAERPLQPAAFQHVIHLQQPKLATPGFSPFIIGGAPAPDGSLPSTAYVQTQFADGSGAGCTGSVIAPTIVVTAAHCFVGESNVSQVLV